MSKMWAPNRAFPRVGLEILAYMDGFIRTFLDMGGIKRS